MFPMHQNVEDISKGFGNLLANVNVLGPLFMALDRILIIAFPHSFKKHEKKMRFAKIIWATIQGSYIIGSFVLKFFFDVSLVEIIAFRLFWVMIFVLQILLCVALYAVIVCKVRAAARKVQPAAPTMPQKQ